MEQYIILYTQIKKEHLIFEVEDVFVDTGFEITGCPVVPDNQNHAWATKSLLMDFHGTSILKCPLQSVNKVKHQEEKPSRYFHEQT